MKKLLSKAIILLAFLAAVTTAKSQSEYAKLYWIGSSPSDIQSINVNGTGLTTLYQSGNSGYSMDVDVPNNKMYWYDQDLEAILTSNLAGGDVETLIDNVPLAQGISIDFASNKLFWAGVNAIESVNLDGTGRTTVLSTASSYGIPTAVKVDVTHQKIYWFDYNVYAVKRANTDGTGEETFISYTGGPVYQIDIDEANSKMYLPIIGTNTIESINLDGSGHTTLISGYSTAGWPNALAVDKVNGKIYWWDSDNYLIKRSNLNGGSVETFLTDIYTVSAMIIPVQIAPEITSQPSPSTICAGTNTSFSVTATGASSYQWQVNPGTGYVNVTNGGVYSNATTATLNITGATAAMSSYNYRCVITGVTSVNSYGAQLTVNALPAITLQPQNEAMCEGDNIVFTSSASGATGYKWQYDTGSGSGFTDVPNSTPYSGVTSTTLSITGATNGMSGYQYQLVATGGCAPAATSSSATLTVYPLVTYYFDNDGDGYGDPFFTTSSCTGTPFMFVSNNEDCNDYDNTIYPFAPEICDDGIDNDCDGDTDEDCVPAAEISAASCGTTLEYLNTQYISADPVVNAEQYEFRIANGAYTATATDNLQAGKVRIIQFAGYEYNTTYQIDVRVKVGGVWGDYGTACSITTTAAPHSEISATQCSTTLPAMNSTIYATTVNGATQYRFRIVNGANVQTIDRSVRTFNMTMLGSYEYNTTYTIDVAVEFDGAWQPYSSACNITTPPLGTSAVLPSQCGTTLAAVTSSIFASSVSGATQYRFRVVNGANVQTIDKPSASFKLTELPAYAFSTAYTIDVAIEYNGMWQAYGATCNVATPAVPSTQIQASQCGASLAAMTTYIYATSVSGATAYRFRFTEGANVQTYTSSTRAMNVTMLATHKASTTYAVEVAVQLNGTWGAYGSACNITTPAVPTKIQASQCGTTLAKLDKLIYADAVNLATAYRFRITNGASVQTIDRTSNSFYLTQLASYAYGTTYTIDVAVQYGGIWQPYGTVCNVSTPAAGSVTTTLTSASCGITVSANTQTLSADKVLGATQYEFLVENAGLSYSQSVVNNAFTFNLAQLAGITDATTYTVKVRTKVNNTWSPYGAVCNVTSAGSIPRPESGEVAEGTIPSAFEAVAFPNPFSNGFGISVQTPGDELITVTVYDMSGKLLDAQTLSANDLNALRIGETYATGVYQVKVVQGTETKTLKVVKQ